MADDVAYTTPDDAAVVPTLNPYNDEEEAAEAGVAESASEERKEMMEEQKESAVAKAQGVCRGILLSLRICVQTHM